MKLLQKTNRYYLAAALLLFGAGILLFFVMLNYIMSEESTEQLQLERERITRSLKEIGHVPDHVLSAGDRIKIVPIQSPKATPETLKDTVMYDADEKENLPFRILSFNDRVNEQDYRVEISRPLFEADDLITAIVKAMLILFASLLVVLFFLNRFISKKLWKPFYASMDKLKNYQIGSGPVLHQERSGINEFDELNAVLEKMTEKIHADYQNLKDFTENASHELQTPLAIQQSKLELLIQSKGLDEHQIKLIGEIYESSKRLSKLNQALILLTRINNKQYPETKRINLSELFKTRAAYFAELISHKEIKLKLDLNGGMEIDMNPVLADILVSNLLGNAIKHNVKGGSISITGGPAQLSISNTGNELNITPEQLFERFRKGDASSDSLGLGLAISKQICEACGLEISYSWEAPLHTLTLKSKAR